MSTSTITIKYVTQLSPQKTSISPSQAQCDMGFLWADMGDDGKNHVIL